MTHQLNIPSMIQIGYKVVSCYYDCKGMNILCLQNSETGECVYRLSGGSLRKGCWTHYFKDINSANDFFIKHQKGKDFKSGKWIRDKKSEKLYGIQR